MDKLLPQQQELVMKVYFQDKSITEIAREEKVTEGAIRDRLKKNLQEIKKYFMLGATFLHFSLLIYRGQKNKEVNFMQTIKITVTNPKGANIVIKEIRPKQKNLREKLLDLMKQVTERSTK